MRVVKFALVVLALSGCSVVSAQTPQTQPLIQEQHVVYKGFWTLPAHDGTNTEPHLFKTIGRVLAVASDGTSVWVSCQKSFNLVARVTIPAIGGVAKVVQPCVSPGNLALVDPDASESKIWGGGLVYNGRFIATGFPTYDGASNQTASHFVAPEATITASTGPYRLTVTPSTPPPAGPGIVAGYMGVVPSDWQPIMGGPAMTGLSFASVIARSSYGPTVSVFNPDHLDTAAPPLASRVLGYTPAYPMPGANLADEIGGFVWPSGTRTILFLGRHGDTYCYGSGQPWACNDPTSLNQGTHAYPYRHRYYAYDANDIVAVKTGTKLFHEVVPYATWDAPNMVVQTGRASVTSVAWHESTRTLLTVADSVNWLPTRVHVYEIPAIKHAPINATYEPWPEAWTPTSEWTPCQPDGTRTQQQTQTRKERTPAQYDGLTEETVRFQEVSQACTYIPRDVALTCALVEPITMNGDDQVATFHCDPPAGSTLPWSHTFTMTVPRPQ